MTVPATLLANTSLIQPLHIVKPIEPAGFVEAIANLTAGRMAG